MPPTSFPQIDLRGLPAAGEVSEQDRMRALIEMLSTSIEYLHGGSVQFIAFDGAVLKIKMAGACLGCPLSPVTLHGWVEGTARQFFPNLKHVEAV